MNRKIHVELTAYCILHSMKVIRPYFGFLKEHESSCNALFTADQSLSSSGRGKEWHVEMLIHFTQLMLLY